MKTDAIRLRSWIAYLIGGLVGAVVGAIVAVNIMIFSGVERGYEAGLDEVFEHNVLAGVAVLGALLAGPLVGLLATRRRRRSR